MSAQRMAVVAVPQGTLSSQILSAFRENASATDAEIAEQLLDDIQSYADLRALVVYLVVGEVHRLRRDYQNDLDDLGARVKMGKPSERIIRLIGGEDAVEVAPAAIREQWLSEGFFTPKFGKVTWAEAEAKHHEDRIAYLNAHKVGYIERVDKNVANHQWALKAIKKANVRNLGEYFALPELQS